MFEIVGAQQLLPENNTAEYHFYLEFTAVILSGPWPRGAFKP
jgi:hypothetical protein